MTQALVLISLLSIPAYIFRFSFFGLPTNAFEIVLLLALLSYLWDFRKRGNKVTFGSPWVYILLAVALFSVFVASDRTQALGIFKGWFLVPATLYFLIINTFSRDNIKYLSIPLYLSLMIVSVWAIMQKIGIISTAFYQFGDTGFADYVLRGRAFGPFESPNYLAMYLVPLFFLSMPILEFFRRRFDQFLFFATFIIPIFALYASHSLGGLLAFGFGLLAFLSFRLTRDGKVETREAKVKLRNTIIGLVIAAAVFAYIFSSIGPETYSKNIRIEIYRYGLELGRSHPILGIGPGEFQRSVEEISKANAGFQLYGLSYALHPHNVFLAFWLNLGITGLLVFLILIISFFVRISRRNSPVFISCALCAAMVAILVHGMIDTTYFKNDLSAIFFLLLAISEILRRENE